MQPLEQDQVTGTCERWVDSGHKDLSTWSAASGETGMREYCWGAWASV